MTALVVPWLRWLLVVEILGLLAWPLVHRALGRLPDRGYFAAKSVGLLLFGVLSWLGFSLGLLRNDQGGACLAAAGLGLAAHASRSGVASCWTWARANAWIVLTAEAVFGVAFALCAVARAFDPAADHTERPMDLLLLAGIDASPVYPPRDPWLSGHAISYYYFGHWLLAGLGRLAGLPPALSYNLGLACWFGLLVSGAFGLGFVLTALVDPGRRRAALATGALAAGLVACVGNPQGAADVLQRHGVDLTAFAQGRVAHNFAPPPEHWWWWRASRVLEDREPGGDAVEIIDEFPAFSYVIGDAHAHVLAMPFGMLCMLLALDLHLGLRADQRRLGERAGLVLAMVAIGALLFANTWDFPAQWTLAVLAAVLAGAWRAGAVIGVAVPFGAALLYLPYLVASQSQAEGLRSALAHPTPLPQLLLMFGGLLLGVAPLAFDGLRSRRAWGLALGCGAVGPMLVAGLVHGNATPRPTLGMLGFLLASLVLAGLSEERRAPARRFALLLAGLGVWLAIVPELVFIADGFGTRMNTVFKMYYQAWLFLAVAASLGIVEGLRAGRAARATACAALVVGAGGVWYTAEALATEMGRGGTPTFDALAYARESAPDEWAAIEWIREHAPLDAVVLQAKGASYRSEQSRLSVATGRATLLGWEGHELQWRGARFAAMTDGRDAALDVVYRSGNAASLGETLGRFGIGYVFVGPFERENHGIDAVREAVLGQALERVFSSGGVAVYRARPVQEPAP